jgi:aldehyde dehydrogenase (NAD+)
MPFPIPTEKIERRHLINGEFSESSDKGTFKLTSPYNHEHITDVYEATVEDTDRAVAAAKAAFPAWAALDPPTRGAYLKKIADLITENATELAQLDAMSMGRPVSSYFDTMFASGAFDHWAQSGWDAKGSTSLNTPGFVNMTFRQPIGPVVRIQQMA